MPYRIICVLISILCIGFCGIHTNAYTGQQIVTLPAGGFRFWDAASFDKIFENHLQTAVLTSLPDSNRCVLYLHGKPLQIGQMITYSQLTQVAMCTAKDSAPVSIGILLYPSSAQSKKFRIHCINPKF